VLHGKVSTTAAAPCSSSSRGTAEKDLLGQAATELLGDNNTAARERDDLANQRVDDDNMLARVTFFVTCVEEKFE
jgi:hypothetical protein